MVIYAIHGLIGSGKDTLCNFILEKYKEDAIKLSFASILKDIISIVFGWDREMLEGSTQESRIWREKRDEWWSNRLNMPNLTPRFILQNWGTDVIRNNFHEDIWIAALENKIRNCGKKVVVITDCRFLNEINFLKTLNAKFVYMKRGEEPEWLVNYKNHKIIPKNIHQSEYIWMENNKFDIIIENNGTLENLKIIVEGMF